MNKESLVIKSILNHCLDDWLELTWFPQLIAEQFPAITPNETLALSIKIIKKLLAEKLIEVGDLTGEKGRFKPWDMEPDDILKKIKYRWIQCEGPYDRKNGDGVCWLATTELGDKLGEANRGHSGTTAPS